MNPMLTSYLTQLAVQSPVLIVYVIGLVLAIVFWARYPGPAVLTFVALALLLVITLAFPLVQMYVVRVRAESTWSMQKYGTVMSVVGVVSSILRAAAGGLLLSAVFMGRGRSPASDV